MTKDIHIDHTFIKTPYRIVIDGINYPIHKWNIGVIEEYWETDDESVLDKLKDFSLDI
jgi:hypothetical protein